MCRNFIAQGTDNNFTALLLYIDRGVAACQVNYYLTFPFCTALKADIRYTLSRLLYRHWRYGCLSAVNFKNKSIAFNRSEEHTSELQSRPHLVCRLLLE